MEGLLLHTITSDRQPWDRRCSWRHDYRTDHGRPTGL